MIFYKILPFFMIFFAFFTLITAADDRLFVGVSPSVVDLGELNKGTTNLVSFYVVTVSEDPLLINLEAENGRLEFFNNAYKNLIFNYSEEDTAKWVKFLSNPVELRPVNESIKTNYESIKGWREVNFLIEIPKDAEAGYHLVKINPVPSEAGGTAGRVGTSVVTLASVNVIFKVSGNAKREGVILDTIGNHYKYDEMDVDTYFQNIGTTTITAMAIQKFYDANDNFIAELSSSRYTIKPEEVKIIKNILPLSGLSFGDYKVLTSVSYTSDSSYKNSTISVTPEILAVPKAQAEEFPQWIFIVIIIIIAIIIYRRIH